MILEGSVPTQEAVEQARMFLTAAIILLVLLGFLELLLNLPDGEE